MLALIGLAVSILPGLINLIAGDKAGTVGADVAKAVTSVTGTSDPVLRNKSWRPIPPLPPNCRPAWLRSR